MPRITCKSQSLLLCLAIGALSAQCALGADADILSNSTVSSSIPLPLSLDLGTGATAGVDHSFIVKSVPEAMLDLGSGAARPVSTPAQALVLSADGVDPNKPFAEHGTGVIEHALALVGVTYRRGGNSAESGLDCSGLVRLVFHDVTGLDLPRRAIEISHLGQRVKPQDLQPGDLLFFNTVRRTISHVGIYLGDGQFIHAPASGGRVRVESMNMPYWIKRFSVARRLPEQEDPLAQ